MLDCERSACAAASPPGTDARSTPWVPGGHDPARRASLLERLAALNSGGVGPNRSVSEEPAVLIAGAFAAEVARIWPGPYFADYRTAPDARRHVWHCWLASDGAGLEARFRAHPALARRRLTVRKARELLAAAYGACPPGLVGALGCCGPEARTPRFYRLLVTVLAEGGARAKMVWHGRDVPAALTRALGFDPEAPARRDTDPWSIVADASQPVCVTFPPPPWPGGTRLRPVRSSADLRATGAALGNCLARPSVASAAAAEVVQGVRFYYEWTGPEPALLQIDKRSCRWRLTECKGAQNARVSDGTWAEIGRALAGLD